MRISDRPVRPIVRLPVLLAVAALAGACGGSSSDDDAGQAATDTTVVPADASTEQPDVGDEQAATDTTVVPADASTGTGTGESTTTTAVDADTATATPTTEPPDTATTEPNEDERLAMDVWAVVFDSEADFAAKAPHLENAEQLEASNTAYAEAGAAVGGVGLDPTAAAIDGDTATITYDVLFAGNPMYQDLSGTMRSVDGVWTVSRDSYCGFLATARAPCEE